MAFRLARMGGAALGMAILIATTAVPYPAHAVTMSFKQAVAEAAATDDSVAAFYREREYAPIWTGSSEASRLRRAAFLEALEQSGEHALPVSSYDIGGLKARMGAARSHRDRGLLEAEMSRLFVRYAHDVNSGVVIPSEVDEGIKREVNRRDGLELLNSFVYASPREFFKELAPATHEYAHLMKEKRRLETLRAKGGWGAPAAIGTIEPGDRGADVIALRNRLIRMGYLGRTATDTYDRAMQRAVQVFQARHGLAADGVVGETTIEELNRSVDDRLAQVIVAMERERWLNKERGDRHILVNLTDFTAKIIDHGDITFETRSVVGANSSDRRSPEFSDEMEHMVLNPSWYVPRSIATKEYLPMLQRNPNAAGHLVITDVRGRRVDRSAVDFTQFNTRNFPFDMRQPPSRSNALGLVKFMFPNKYNIYLHDTPAKDLFSRETRAFSHGCIRLNDPFDFAYALLARQVPNPEQYFQSQLASGAETKIELEQHVPVHIIYRTAFSDIKGQMNYRRDVYGRDGRIFDALVKAGVVLRDLQS